MQMNQVTHKITLATVKAFIKKNRGCFYLKRRSQFDGMTDGQESIREDFNLIVETQKHINHSFGIAGVWFVGEGRDFFRAYEDENFNGIEIINCCASFILAVKKP